MPSIFRRPPKKERIAAAAVYTLFAAVLVAGAVVTAFRAMAKAALDLIY